jgi:hypothetical protein
MLPRFDRCAWSLQDEEIAVVFLGVSLSFTEYPSFSSVLYGSAANTRSLLARIAFRGNGVTLSPSLSGIYYHGVRALCLILR